MACQITGPDEGGAKESVCDPVQVVFLSVLANVTEALNCELVNTVEGGGVWLTKYLHCCSSAMG